MIASTTTARITTKFGPEMRKIRQRMAARSVAPVPREHLLFDFNADSQSSWASTSARASHSS